MKDRGQVKMNKPDKNCRSDETWLWRRLTAGDVIPFRNLQKLAPVLGVIVEIHTEGTLRQFEPTIEAGLPVMALCARGAIVAVDMDDA